MLESTSPRQTYESGRHRPIPNFVFRVLIVSIGILGRRATLFAKLSEDAMRFIKVLGILVLVAVACRAVLILLLGHPPGIAIGRFVSDAAGGGLLIFAVSAVAAGIAAYFTRARVEEYPGLTAGVVVALIVTGLMYVSGG